MVEFKTLTAQMMIIPLGQLWFSWCMRSGGVGKVAFGWLGRKHAFCASFLSRRHHTSALTSSHARDGNCFPF